MDDENIRNELRKIAKVMDGFTLETVKIVKIQTELCTVKKENTVLKENVEVLKKSAAVLSTGLGTVEKKNTVLKENVAVLKENVAVLSTELGTVKKESAVLKENAAVLKENVAVLSTELSTVKTEVKRLSGANAALKNLYRASLEHISKSDGEYKSLRSYYDTLRSDLDALKSTFKASKVEHCNEIESDADGVDKLHAVDAEAKSNEPAGAQNQSNPAIKRKPKAQKKREQNETFRKWRQLMSQRKTPKDLLASGLLKFTVELWEDENTLLNENELLDLLKKNVDELTSFISSDEDKNRFFLTLIKVCSMRQVSKPKFPEIMSCFENHGPHRNRITETEIQKFIKLYEEYKA